MPVPSSLDADISRLCLNCGMCCNGVMFQLVRLQPTDSPRALAALGMPLKRKKKGHQFNQPCPCLEGSACTIYSGRPERCRIFECLQIARLRNSETTESAAAGQIREVQQRVARIEALLQEAGNTKVKQPLAERFGRVMALPGDPQWHAETLRLKQRLHEEMRELNDLLNQDFRLTPVPLAEQGQPAPSTPLDGDA